MSGDARIEKALARAREDAAAMIVNTARDGHPRKRRLAIGDAQAPTQRMLEILDRHGALGEDGRLAPDVALISIGDHFDFGDDAVRAEAGECGVQILCWLAAHPVDQTTLILGNHDLARVCELGAFDDRRFAEAQSEAVRAYNKGSPIPELEEAFLEKYPELPTAELVARDFSSYSERQRELVIALLLARRFTIAHATARDLLFVHAGVTESDLSGMSKREQSDAFAIEAAMSERLEHALEDWKKRGLLGRLELSPLHEPGNARIGETRGIFQHRPAHPEGSPPRDFDGPPRRRFDPRWLPRGMTQVIGHIRDNKCRRLLGPWADRAEAIDGPLRYLATDGKDVRYARGTPPIEKEHAGMYFLDGGMYYGKDPALYQLFDVGARAPA